MRGEHRFVAVSNQPFVDQLLQLLTHPSAIRQKHRQPAADCCVDLEEFHLLPNFAVIPLLSLFQLGQVILQFLF